ncbi:hypothetical protein V8C35DRAFT_319767 [Trichoderma chlorosporum]
MPAAIADAPAVAMSFANNFWGKDDAGVGPLLDRMVNSKQTCDELKSFYGARSAIEDEYARKLLNLSKKTLGTHESGTLKTSLDTVRGELEAMAKQHQSIAAQMKTELEEPLAAFAGGNKERRKIVQGTVEKLLKVKVQQTNQVNKTRDKYEQECLKIKGYLAQGHMVMGQEERRNKAKLEKTQISLATSNTEYENAVKVLEETTVRWNREWKAAADKFQDLEEERLDFTKNSLWTFANIASTVCVSDDASCEKIRLSLESMDVETDIITFITERGTGQEIPEAPKYINFVRGDVHDTQSEASEDEHNYTVAQFPRSINPAFRSSSPQPSTFESHHDPNSALANDLAHRPPPKPTGREGASTPQRSPQKLLPSGRPSMDEQYRKQQPPSGDDRYRKPPPGAEDQYRRQLPSAEEPQQQQQHYGRQPPAADDQYRRQPPAAEDQYRRQPPSSEEQFRRSQTGSQPPSPYDSLHQSPKPTTPHDPYPKDGMTMLCRPGTQSVGSSSQIQSARNSGRDSRSEYSDPTSISSQEPQSGKTSPVKQDQSASASPDNRMLKKKSGFFQNHSPFRRKSTKDLQAAAGTAQPSNRNTWHPSQSQTSTSPVRRPQPYGNSEPQTRNLLKERTASPEPIDANASLALGVGENVLPVTTPDSNRQRPQQPAQKAAPADPIAAALAELKNVNVGKQASVRMSADHYHGISSPVPNTEAAMTRAFPAPGSHDAAAATRGTPPPSYQAQTQVTRLGVPPPAVTSRAMKEATQKITSQSRSIYGEEARRGSVSSAASPISRPGTRGNDGSVSPATNRGASPQPQRRMSNDPRQTGRQSVSPNPYHDHRRNGSQTSLSQQNQGYYRGASPHGSTRGSTRGASPNPYRGSARGASPNPYRGDYNQSQSRPPSSYGGSEMAVQLANGGGGDDRYGSTRSRSSVRPGSRAVGLYDGGHQRSKSVADPSRQYSRDGRPILHMARAMFMYQAAIPEELGFAKGDYLAVYRHQDDGWWEAEVHNGSGQIGLETFQDTARVVTSKPVQRAVVNVVLLVSGAATLLCLAAVASVLFFQNFVPDQFVTTPIHLQYGLSSNPYGVAALTVPMLKSQQDYDISVTLSMPRSLPNVERGNFMISLYLLGSKTSDALDVSARRFANDHSNFEPSNVLFRSRRPALLPYVDPVVSLASRILFLLYHLIVPTAQTCILNVPVAERVKFPTDSAVPSTAYVEVEAGQGIQIYSASLTMTAQLSGLRWLMFHYRLLTFITFTMLFWVCEVAFMIVAWAILSSLLGSSPGNMDLKSHRNQRRSTTGGLTDSDGYDENDDGDDPSDYPHQFPTYGNQPPLKHEPDVKDEDEPRQPLQEIPVAGEEADDEEEDGEEPRDSGIGTSYSGEGSSTVRKRSVRSDLE